MISLEIDEAGITTDGVDGPDLSILGSAVVGACVCTGVDAGVGCPNLGISEVLEVVVEGRGDVGWVLSDSLVSVSSSWALEILTGSKILDLVPCLISRVLGGVNWRSEHQNVTKEVRQVGKFLTLSSLTSVIGVNWLSFSKRISFETVRGTPEILHLLPLSLGGVLISGQGVRGMIFESILRDPWVASRIFWESLGERKARSIPRGWVSIPYGIILADLCTAKINFSSLKRKEKWARRKVISFSSGGFAHAAAFSANDMVKMGRRWKEEIRKKKNKNKNGK